MFNPLDRLFMKYVNSCGTLCVSSGKGAKFVNFMAAVMAMNAIQMFYAHFGYSVHSDICQSTRNVEVRIHFETFDMPALPAGYLYSRREVTSVAYEGSFAKPGARVRVMSYSFEF